MPITAPTVITYALDDPSAVAVPNTEVTATLQPSGAGDRSDDDAVVIGTARTTTDSNGAFSLPLVPNSAFRTSGTWYWVVIDGGPSYAIVVPVSASAVSLWACRVDPATLVPVPEPAPSAYLLRAERGAPNGVASLGPDGLVLSSQLPVAGGGVPTSRQIISGTGLTGGGDLTADRTLAVVYGSTAGTAAQGNDARLSDARTPLAHAHAIADVTGLQAALDALPRIAATTQAGTSYTLALADAGTAVEFTNSAAVTCTVPPNSATAFPVGTVIELLQYGTGQITVVAGTGVTIRTASSMTTRAQYSVLSLRKRAADEWILSGDLT